MASVLVVEDEHIVAADIRRTLLSLGYTVCGTACGGREAVDKALALQPDIILMDIRLNDDVSGIEAADMIRRHREIPVVYLTAYADDATLQRARITEPFGYIIKPFTKRDLRTTIEIALYKTRVDREVRRKERWLSTTLRSIGDAVIATDADGRVMFLNERAAQLTGRSEEDAAGRDISEVFSIVHDETRAHLNGIGGTAQTRSVALLVSDRSNREVPVEYTASPIRDDNDNVTGTVVVFRDISEQRASRRSIIELARLSRENPSPVLRIDDRGGIQYANPAGTALLTAWETTSGLCAPRHIINAAATALDTGLQTTAEERIDDRLYTLTFVPYPEERSVNIYGNDITELRRADTALRESHRRLHDILEKIPAIALMLDNRGTVTFCNDYLAQLLGMEKSKVVGLSWFDTFIPEQERDAVRAQFIDRNGNDPIPPYFDNTIVAAGGTHRLISWTNTLLRDSGGRISGMAGIGIDITERRRETQALRDSEERYRKLVELSPLGIVMHAGGEIVFSNPAAARIVGADSPQELVGRKVLDFVAPDYRPAVLRRIAELTGSQAQVDLFEEQFIRLDGMLIDVEVSAIPAVYNGVPAVQVVFLDTTERKKSQRQVEKQYIQLQSLYDLHYHAGHSQSIEDLYEAGLRALERTLSVTRSSVLLFDDQGVMRFVHWHNLSDTYRARTDGRSPWSPDDPSPTTIVVNDVQQDPFVAGIREDLLREGIRSMIFIPLRVDNRLIGKFMLYFDTPRTFASEEKLLIDTIANHFEFALSGITAETRLRESEEKFRMVSEKTSAVIAMVGDTYLYVNPAFAKITGYSPAEAAALPFHELIHPDFREEIMRTVPGVLRHRRPFRSECSIVTKQGAVRWLDIMLDSIPYGGQDVVFLTGVDITERKQNELLIRAQKEILQMIAHGDDVSAIFPAIQAFVEQQATGTQCTIYTPDGGRLFRPAAGTEAGTLPDHFPSALDSSDPGFIGEAIRNRSQVCECLVVNAIGTTPVQNPDIRSTCAYPVLDSRKQVLGVVVVVNGTYDNFEQRAIQIIQIAAQLTSIALERDRTFSALEQALQKNFRRVVQNLQNHVFKLERRKTDYFYTLSEGRLAELDEMTTEHVQNTPLSQLFTPEVYSAVLPNIEQAFAGEAVSFEEQHGNRWFLTTYEPIFGDNGAIAEVIGSSVEITRQKLVEEDLRTSEERYRLIVDTLPIGIMKMTLADNENWSYEYTNAYAALQTGYTPEELSDAEHQANTIAIHPDDQAVLGEQWSTWLRDPERRTIHLTYRYRHKKGHYIWLDNYAIKIINPNTKIQEIIQMVIDITEQKKAEQELHLALAKERELNSLKTRFVSTVSHEFRTPLTGILMSTELLERYFDKLKPERRLEEVTKIKSRVNELTELMDEFLLQSSMQSMAERFRPDHVDLAALSKRCFQELQSLLVENPHTIISSIPDNLPGINGDPRLLRHVVQNLLSNAVKYSPPHSEIFFSLHHDNGQIAVEVRDQGIGIPDEELPRLFTPFFRASNTGKIKGTGLGLSIIKEFIEIHGGTISVHSQVGRGTTFTVVLPTEAHRPKAEEVEATECTKDEQNRAVID